MTERTAPACLGVQQCSLSLLQPTAVSRPTSGSLDSSSLLLNWAAPFEPVPTHWLICRTGKYGGLGGMQDCGLKDLSYFSLTLG